MTTYTVPGKKLDEAVSEQMMGGYRTIERGANSAVMAKPKEFSFAAFLVLTLCGIIPGILYVGWYMAKSDSMLRLDYAGGDVTYTFH